MTLARHDPDRIPALDPPTWSKWAPAIVGAWVSAPDDGMKRPCDLADLAPPDSRRFITDAALGHLDALQEHGGLLQHPLYEHLCQELADDLAERLQAGRYTGNLACTLLGLLIANAPTIAAPACRQLPVGSSPELAEAARRGQAQLEPATVVDELAAVDADAAGLAEIVPHLNVLKLDNVRLAVLARLLVSRFPLAADPPLQLGRSYSGAQEDCRRIRHAALERLAQLGQESLLRDLVRECPEPDQGFLAGYLRHARARAGYLPVTTTQTPPDINLNSRTAARLNRTAHP
jgi:hypothetical protein